MQILKANSQNGGHCDYHKFQIQYNTAVQNTKKFNLGLLTLKKTSLANGQKAEFFRKDTKELLLEWYLIHDAQGWELGNVTYKSQGV